MWLTKSTPKHSRAYWREIGAIRKSHIDRLRNPDKHPVPSLPTKEPDVAKGKLIIVGADKGGVGKTMISRLLIDWIGSQLSPFTVFDTEAALDGKTSLRRFHPDAKVSDIGAVAGQMQIFDNLERGGISLVDMRAGMLSQTLRTMRNAGLLDQADAGRVQMTVVHVLGSSTQSMSEIVDVAALLGGDSAQVLVENHANDGQFFKWDEAR